MRHSSKVPSPKLNPIERIGKSTAGVLASFVADAIAIATVTIFNDDVATWASQHALVFVVATIVLLTTTLVFGANLYSASRLRKKNQAIQPTPLDEERFIRFERDFGPVSRLHGWIFDRFFAKMVPAPDMQELERVTKKLEADPVEYHDKIVEGSYKLLVSALVRLSELTIEHYSPAGSDHERFEITTGLRSRDSDREYYRAISQINDAHAEVVDSWSNLARSAYERGLGWKLAEP